YERGEGVSQDYGTAVELYQLAAEHGLAEGQGALGRMFMRGEGIPQHFEAGTELFRLAAEQGDATAQFHLGIAYIAGFGVPQDRIYGHVWLNLSASSGHEQAGEWRDRVAGEMTPEQITEAQKLAAECLKNDYKGCS
ncbi:MAG: sel1 repeat family protein, partial [Alphaproteobacteria bacterium]|nr:sel1 repeat family protein [Alphaproteobacteria bacterium]